jgi:HlyD family secretion protein
MKKRKVPRNLLLLISFLFILAILIFYSLRPAAVPVEVGTVKRGPMTVTVDEQGQTRAHDRFIISSPVPGQLMRIELHEGDPVRAGDLVAFVNPSPLSERERLELTSREQAAAAYKTEAEQRVRQQQAAYDQSVRDRQRAEQLARETLISSQQLEQARNNELIARRELDAAKSRARAAASEREIASAGLIALKPGSNLVKLYSPANGSVLKIPDKSERVLEAGAPLLVIGDPGKLEIVVDVLSTEAVKIKPGNEVSIVNWGGDLPLHGKVRVVEPLAFTKVSSLGIEEQRVNVIVDLLDRPPELRDGYRVECRIQTWFGADVLTVPTSALFRRGQEWGVFVLQGDKAALRIIQIGNRTSSLTQVVAGLTPGETVILYPSNELVENMRVEIIQR